MRGPVISAPDPFAFPDFLNTASPTWRKTSNKTMASTVLNAGLRNLVLLIVGQSQMGNVNPTAYVPTNITKINNFNIFDGACYQATGSLLGCTNYDVTNEHGNPATRVADMLITNNICDVVWLITPAVGGTPVAAWDTGGCSQRVGIAVARLAAIGIPASRIDGVLWGQGETDSLIGTPQANYQGSLASVIAKSRALGITAPWFIARESFYGGTTYPAIQAAQAAIISHASGIWAGSDGDSIDGTTANRWDGLHFSDAGAATYAAGWYNSLVAYGTPF